MNDVANTISIPENENDVIELVESMHGIVPTGQGTKTALSSGANVSLRKLSGIVDYDPAEYTFTANAGTPVEAIMQELQSKGQYLPFDPPLFDGQATIGGTIAAGVSGSGRFRFGGARDFIIALRMVTGKGEAIRGGAKVVKNAAGFDLPKLMVGSCGNLGILTQLSFKVFPEPRASATMVAHCDEKPLAIRLLMQLANANLELHCIDMERIDMKRIDMERTDVQPQHRLLIRARGFPSTLTDQISRVKNLLEIPCEVLTGQDESRIWRQASQFDWLSVEQHLVKVVLTPSQVQAFTELFQDTVYRIVSAGHFAWIGWPANRDHRDLIERLARIGRFAQWITGPKNLATSDRPNCEFYRRIKEALDPDNRLGKHHAA